MIPDLEAFAWPHWGGLIHFLAVLEDVQGFDDPNYTIYENPGIQRKKDLMLDCEALVIS